MNKIKSPNHRQILDLLAHGWKIKDIALEFNITHNALVVKISRMKNLMGAKTIPHAIFMFVNRPLFNKNGRWVERK